MVRFATEGVRWQIACYSNLKLFAYFSLHVEIQGYFMRLIIKKFHSWPSKVMLKVPYAGRESWGSFNYFSFFPPGSSGGGKLPQDR